MRSAQRGSTDQTSKGILKFGARAISSVSDYPGFHCANKVYIYIFFFTLFTINVGRGYGDVR